MRPGLTSVGIGKPDKRMHGGICLGSEGKYMIDLYYWTTPNGHKITIFLEETGLPYRIVPVNISKGEQFKPEFLRDLSEQPHASDRRSQPKDGGAPILSSNPVRFLFISPTRPASTCRRHPRSNRSAWNGCSGRWAVSGRWRAKTIISRTTRRRNFPTRSIATSRKPTVSMACSTNS